MSIRMRLTLLYTLILAGTLLGFSSLLYVTMEGSTRRFMEDTLATEMKRLPPENHSSLGNISWPPGSPNTSETYWQACDSKGNVMGQTDNLMSHSLPLSSDGLSRLQSGESLYEVAEVDGTTLLVYNRPIMSQGKTTGILQVARSVADQQQALQTLQTYLIAGGLFT